MEISLFKKVREFIEKISWDTNSDEEDISIDEKIVKFYKKPI